MRIPKRRNLNRLVHSNITQSVVNPIVEITSNVTTEIQLYPTLALFLTWQKGIDKVLRIFDDIVSLIFDVMKELTKNNGGKDILDYIETKTYIGASGKHDRLHGTLTCGANNSKLIGKEIQAQMTDWVKITPVIDHGIHLDNYLTDMGTKELLEQHIGANS